VLTLAAYLDTYEGPKGYVLSVHIIIRLSR
jgi:hypothetical protein